MADAIIDFRSDTVTRPSAEMRAAMANAEVGDDVYGDDPTVNALQEFAADLLGKEAALFVPSGTMANQLAVRAQTQPGDEILAGKDAHLWLFESGGAAALSGVQVRIADGDGRFAATEVTRHFHAGDDPHQSPTRLVAIENSHNWSGGQVWPLAEQRAVIDAANGLGLLAHLDGARLWNAATALSVSERELAAGFDTVSVCLSKGLGAPVGSLLAGSKSTIKRAHRFRKMLGGGMRQVGILAAAGRYALDHHRAGIATDHTNAKLLATGLSAIDGCSVETDKVVTNIVWLELDAGGAMALRDAARAKGVLFGAFSATRMRLVTHRDVDRAGCERAVEIIAELVGRGAHRTA